MSRADYRPGNREDFDRLYRETHSRLLATLIPVVRDRAAAEDCLQEAFIRAFRAWDRWQPNAPAEAWLHRIALRVAINHRRREQLHSAVELVARLGRPRAGADPVSLALHNDLLVALRRLPPKQSAAIVLRHLHGYTNREIAVALEVSERTVASRLAAAKERLKRELGPAWDPRMGTFDGLAVSSADG